MKAQDILELGSKVLIRTVTMAHVGRVVWIDEKFIGLDEGGWVADTGRFSEALAHGKLSEFEKCDTPFLVSRDGLIDVFPWQHDLPKLTI